MKILLISFLVLFILLFIYNKNNIENFENNYVINNLDNYWENGIENKNIGIVTQFTKEIYDYSKYSLQNLKYYCQKTKI